MNIEVADEPGAGGANHEYLIEWSRPQTKDEAAGLQPDSSYSFRRISFQNGPIKEVGVNGITQEALLAITIDRLRSFQDGPYACADNAEALTHCEAALKCLQRRTLARIARGVEGTHTK